MVCTAGGCGSWMSHLEEPVSNRSSVQYPEGTRNKKVWREVCGCLWGGGRKGEGLGVLESR